MKDEEIAEERATKFTEINYNEPDNYGTEKEIGYHAYYCGFLAGLKAGRPQWHDLQKDPTDLPKKEKLGQTFVVAFAFNEQTQKYYSFDCAEYIDKGRFITHTIDGSNENNAYKIIAWCEIPTFDKE